MLISLQMKMLQFDGQPLSGRATDVWSSGYVFGVFDYLQQTFGMSDLDECMHLNVVLFQGLFGGSVGSRMIDSYYENQMDLDAVEGALTGGNEVLRWRRDTNCIPMGWFLHVRGETKV